MSGDGTVVVGPKDAGGWYNSNGNWYDGTGPMEAAMSVYNGAKSGDVLTALGNTAVVGLTAIGVVMDPFQAVFAAGVGWLMEHFKPLRWPLDKLLGNPSEIQNYASTLHNVERRLYAATDRYVDDVKDNVGRWTSDAATAYRKLAREHAERVQAIGKIADSLSHMTVTAGVAVGVVRNTVRDIIADVVGAAISKALQAATIILIPKVAAEIGLLVAKTSVRILNALRQLFRCLEQIKGLGGAASKVLGGIDDAMKGIIMLGGRRVAMADDVINNGRGAHSIADILKQLHRGHTDPWAHGTIPKNLGNVAKNGARDNANQNIAGAPKLRQGDDDNPNPENRDPKDIDLPL